MQPEKKERMIVQEATTNNAETYNRKQVWKISLDESAKVCNDMYGTNISFEIVEPKQLDMFHVEQSGNENGGEED